MDLQILKADPETESEALCRMQEAVLPDEAPFGNIWSEEKVETHWIIVNNEKAGIISIERDSEPGTSYEAESLPAHGSIYLILIGFLPPWQKKGLG
jgi:hypothetical protein